MKAYEYEIKEIGFSTSNRAQAGKQRRKCERHYKKEIKLYLNQYEYQNGKWILTGTTEIKHNKNHKKYNQSQ